MPPITPPPASTRARFSGPLSHGSRLSSELSTPGASPPEERRPPGEARAEGDQHDEIALLHPAARDGFVQADRHRGGSRVAITLNVVVHARLGDLERHGHGLD